MPNGRKRPLRRRPGAGRRRKTNVKRRGLSKTEKKEVKAIVHGEAEAKSFRNFSGEYEPHGGWNAIDEIYRPLVVDFQLPIMQGTDDMQRIGTEINVLFNRFRLEFDICRSYDAQGTSKSTLDDCPRKFKIWVVSNKNTVQYPASSADPVIDLDKFFRIPTTGYSGTYTYSGFQGNMNDMFYEVNTDEYTVHKSMTFTLGLGPCVKTFDWIDSTDKTNLQFFKYGAGTPSIYQGKDVASKIDPGLPHEQTNRADMSQANVADYTNTFPYHKSVTVSMPKSKIGRTKFVQSYTSATAKPNKRCWLVIHSVRIDGTDDKYRFAYDEVENKYVPPTRFGVCTREIRHMKYTDL